ncbi:GH25 family lysozyme [Leuconostoc mesenteroides]|uniref:GH25 family lysozyme n=1 Tax=Leuconostoc mesenteroides TaxID=1245 RepID=UPI00385E3A10
MNKIKFFVKTIVTIMVVVSLSMVLNKVSANSIPAITAGTSGLPKTDVVDISSNNGEVSINDFQKMRNYGIKAVVVKLTEEKSYRNPYAAKQIANARAAGMVVGAYHYSWYTTTASADTEAKYFTDYASSLNLPKDTLMVNDLEDTYTKQNNVTANAIAFNAQVKAAGYSNTAIYTYPSYVNETKLDFSYIGTNRVWMAQYPYAPSANDLWNTIYGMWQWNSNTSFPGVEGTFDVTVDYKNLLVPKTQTNSTDGTYFETVNGKVYYYENGTQYINRFYSNWGKMYYFGSDGARYTNQFYSNWGKMYYFGSDGARYTNQFYSNWGKLYYFGSDGARYTNQFYRNWGHTYYFGSDGARYTGQFYNNWGHKYYFDENGILVTDKTFTVNGVKYSADSNGILHIV